MTSDVRVDIPTAPTARTREMRENFAVIKRELEALQDIVFGSQPQNSPEFSGTAHAENLEVSGNTTLSSLLELSHFSPTLAVSAPISNAVSTLTLTRWPTKMVSLSGSITFDYTNLSPGTAYLIVGVAGVTAPYRPSLANVVLPIIIASSGGISYPGTFVIASNGAIAIGFALDRNTAAANVTATAAVAYCYGIYPGVA